MSLFNSFPPFPLPLQEGKHDLFRAAIAGDIDAVKRHLRGHTSINSKDEVRGIHNIIM